MRDLRTMEDEKEDAERKKKRCLTPEGRNHNLS